MMVIITRVMTMMPMPVIVNNDDDEHADADCDAVAVDDVDYYENGIGNKDKCNNDDKL